MSQSDYKVNNILIPEELPLIALKNTALFPKAVIPLIVQRPKSISALEYAISTERLIFFAAQRSTEDDVAKRDIFTTGTIGRIISVFKLPDGSSKVDVEGLVRARIKEVASEAPFFKVKAAPFPLLVKNNLEEKALLRKAIEQFRIVSETRAFPTILQEIIYMMSQLNDTEHIISLMAINLNLDINEQQNILELESATDALRQLNAYLARESELLEAEKKVVKETKKQLGKMQKE